MSQILTMVAMVIFCIIGGLSSLYLLFSLPAVIIYKLSRCIKYGKSMYD